MNARTSGIIAGIVASGVIGVGFATGAASTTEPAVPPQFNIIEVDSVPSELPTPPTPSHPAGPPSRVPPNPTAWTSPEISAGGGVGGGGGTLPTGGAHPTFKPKPTTTR